MAERRWVSRVFARTMALGVVVALTVPTAPAAGQGAPSLTPLERALLATIDVDAAMEHLRVLTGMGERIAGDEVERAAQRFVEAKMEALPLDSVERHWFPVSSWRHRGDSLRVVAPTVEEIPTTIYAFDPGIWGEWLGEPYSNGTADGGRTLRAPLVDVGYGTEADFNAVDVEGAVVLARRDDDIQGWPTVIAEEAYRHGALAVVNWGYYGNIVHPEGIKQDVGGAPIPEFAISKESATHLKDQLAEGHVTVELRGRADEISEREGRAYNVIGTLEGTTRPDEYIVISGHVDAWWDGASDDSGAIASVLELARILSEARAAGTFENERTIVFVSLAAEEAGGPIGSWYNWLTGSYEFVSDHPEVMDGLVVDLNMDGIGYPNGPGKYWIENTWEVNDFLWDAVSDIGANGEMGYYNPSYSWTDAWSFAAKGGGSAVQSFWVSGFDSLYHTQLDNLAAVDREPFELILRLYTLMAMRASDALIVPLDMTPTLDWAQGFLTAERAAAPSLAKAFDEAESALATLRARVSAANARADGLRAAWADAQTPAERAAIRAEADALNRALIDARRTVTTWSLGEGGTMGSWDVFLRPDQHVKDLAAIDTAVRALSTGPGRISTALRALETVSSMEWGHLFSPGTYRAISEQMINDTMYWGDDFDQQQAYVDVHAIHRGLGDGSMSRDRAATALEGIVRTQLLPWAEEDLMTLGLAWRDAAGML